MNKLITPSQALAAAITRAASLQTYYTIRFLVDSERVADAYRAYAYFRWVDDNLDRSGMQPSERIDFIDRQVVLIEHCYRGNPPGDISKEERMLADLVQGDPLRDSGLYAYLQHMLAVMTFDARRRGRLISAVELSEYTRHLATAVTEALHYFIGHCCYSPQSEARYLAASAAHITHMLRDTFEDNAAGYYNIPGEYLERHRLAPQDVECKPYRAWVSERVHLAREQIQAGKEYLTQVESLRCRIAGYAYLARFEVVLEVIEREGFNLRADYRERKRLGAWMKVCWSAVSSAFGSRRKEPIPGIPSAIKYHKS